MTFAACRQSCLLMSPVTTSITVPSPPATWGEHGEGGEGEGEHGEGEEEERSYKDSVGVLHDLHDVLGLTVALSADHRDLENHKYLPDQTVILPSSYHGH